jgi:hypothetical protein
MAFDRCAWPLLIKVHRAVQSKPENALLRHVERVSACQHLRADTAACSRERFDGGAFGSSGDRAKDGSQHCAARDKFPVRVLAPGPSRRRSRVRFLLFKNVSLAVDTHGAKVNRNFSLAHITDNQMRG